MFYSPTSSASRSGGSATGLRTAPTPATSWSAPPAAAKDKAATTRAARRLPPVLERERARSTSLGARTATVSGRSVRFKIVDVQYYIVIVPVNKTITTQLLFQ